MKIWNTKYALTKGLLEQDAEQSSAHPSMVVVKGGYVAGVLYLHGEGREWHHTREGAIACANVMRQEKIASLRKQLARLEALRFD